MVDAALHEGTESNMSAAFKIRTGSNPVLTTKIKVMKIFLTVLAFCLIVAAFGILIIGSYMEKGQLWVNLFALFFTLAALAFWGWLALENKENKNKVGSLKS